MQQHQRQGVPAPKAEMGQTQAVTKDNINRLPDNVITII